jgi:hypothetical protein
MLCPDQILARALSLLMCEAQYPTGALRKAFHASHYLNLLNLSDKEGCVEFYQKRGGIQCMRKIRV